MGLTKSQEAILELLHERKQMTPKELLKELPFAARTVRYGLRKLVQKKLVKRVPCLQDMRQWIYSI